MEALAKAIAGETTGEIQLRAARTLAEAQLELKRIRATRAATPTDLDQMFDPQTLARLCALNRYERLAASRRMAARRWLDEIAGSLGDAGIGLVPCNMGSQLTERSQFRAAWHEAL